MDQKKTKSKKPSTLKLSKKKHTSILSKLLIGIVIIVVVAFVGFESVMEKNHYDQYKTITDKVYSAFSVDENIVDDIILPTFDEENKIEYTWTSSNPDIISETGKVNRPKFAEGNKQVVLKMVFVYEPNNFMFPVTKNILKIGDKIEYEFKVLVLCRALTDEEIVDMVLDSISIPDRIQSDINLPAHLFREQVNITWASDNITALNSNGTVHRSENNSDVNLTCTVSSNEVTKSKTFAVTVIADVGVDAIVDDNFDERSKTSTYGDVNSTNILYHNVMIKEGEGNNKYLRMRNKSGESAYFETSMIVTAAYISFKCKFDHTQTGNSYFDVYINDNKEKEIIVPHDELQTFTIDLTSYSNFVLKVVHRGFSEMYAILDDVKIMPSENVTQEAISNSIEVESTCSIYLVLPFTSQYGGSISWTSNNIEYLSSYGEVLKRDLEDKKVTVVAHVVYNDISFDQTFEVIVKGTGQSDPLLIYFIDLVIDDVSDTGESIYIKYNNIDILVDAGDNFASTKKAVKDTINAYSDDKVIEYLIATHPDADHIGGMPSVFENFAIKNFIKFNGEGTTQKFLNLKSAYESEEGCNVIDIYDDIMNGDVSKYINISEDIQIEFLDTHHFLDSEPNGKSIVFLLTAYGTKVLMTGDADNLSPHSDLEESYMNQAGDVDILKVVHHGTKNGCKREYLEVVKPEVAIICNGNYLGNKHSHPHVETITNLINYNPDMKIYAITGGGLHCSITSTGGFEGKTTLEESQIDRNGMITITIDNRGYKITSLLKGDNMIDVRNTQYYQSYLAQR